MIFNISATSDSAVFVSPPEEPGPHSGDLWDTPAPQCPPAVGTFYTILFTIRLTTLRFPKSTTTPDPGVSGVGGLRVGARGWALSPRNFRSSKKPFAVPS